MARLFTLLHNISIWVYREPDYKKPHIHVVKGNPRQPECEVIFEIGTWNVIHNQGFNKKAVKKLRLFLEDQEEFINEQWKKLNP